MVDGVRDTPEVRRDRSEATLGYAVDSVAAALLVALIVAALLTWATPDAPSRLAAWTADRPWVEVSPRLRAFFLDAAFVHEDGGVSVGGPTALVKWPAGVVTVGEEGAQSEFDRAAVTGVLRRLQRLSEGVRFNYSTGRTTRIRIRYLSHTEFARRAPGSPGVSVIYRWGPPGAPHALTAVTVLVDSRPTVATARRALLLQGLMRALGFPGQPDDPASPPSVLGRSGRRATGYFSIDRRAIRLLYGGDLEAGMTRQEVDAILVAR